jgi:hypothetical protein
MDMEYIKLKKKESYTFLFPYVAVDTKHRQ